MKNKINVGDYVRIVEPESGAKGMYYSDQETTFKVLRLDKFIGEEFVVECIDFDTTCKLAYEDGEIFTGEDGDDSPVWFEQCWLSKVDEPNITDSNNAIDPTDFFLDV